MRLAPVSQLFHIVASFIKIGYLLPLVQPAFVYSHMRKQFTVPVLPHLKKYVEKQFFAGLKAPYKIEEDTLLGKQFMSLIIDARSIDLRGDKKIEPSAELIIILSDAMAKRSPSLRKLVPINFFLDKLFKDALITWIKASDVAGVRPFVSTKTFLQHYKIEEAEYSHDAAYKVWTRYKSQGHTRKRIFSGEPRTKIGLSASGMVV